MTLDAPGTPAAADTGATVGGPAGNAPAGYAPPGPAAPVGAHSHGGGAERATGPAASKAHARRSYDAADFGVPTGREEDWRFTPLDRLRGLHTAPEGGVGAGPDRRTGTLPAGVTTALVGRDDPRVGSALVPADRPSAEAYGRFDTAFVLSVAPGAVVADPVVVEIVGQGQDRPGYGHTVIEVGAQAEVTIVLDHVGSVTLADNVELLIGENATARVVTVADWATDSVQLQRQHARLARNGRLTHIAVTLGGDLVRQYTTVEFAGPGGEVDAFGIYFADAGQHLEHRLFVDHSVPDCRSNVGYRGALQGVDAHTVWVGDVLIRAAATGTDTYEINRNLILTDGARADSIPNLEIETGEVTGAGHASATGRFDDEQLFYLQSRGIPAEEARRLVVRGFFAEIVERIGVPAVADRLTAAIEARLVKAGA